MKKKISIIMGIYNCAKYLDEAIESILAQTYTNWQMIMCDDCSVDNTYEVASKYVKKYPNKFILIRNEQNQGLNKTLNICLELADGEYIARMDGDDISYPDRFQKEVDFLDSNPEYAIVSCPMEFFDEQGVFGRGKDFGEPQKKNIPKGTPFAHAPCMIRRNAFKDVGGYTVSDKLLRVEDQHLWIKMFSKGYRGYNLPEPLYAMRDDRNAFSRRKYKYRINEARIITIAIKELKLPLWEYIYIFKPLILGILPEWLYLKLHKKKWGI